MIAKLLGDGFIDRKILITSLVFDNNKRDTIDKQDDVGATLFFDAIHTEFIRDMVNVILQIFPINVFKGERLLIALDGFHKALSESYKVINFLVGLDEPFIGYIFKRCDSGLDTAL